MTIDDLQEEQHLHNLLRQIFLKEPTHEFLQGLTALSPVENADDLVSEGLNVLVESVNRNAHRLEEWAEDLSIEYARLFIGPKSPPAVPFASFYLSESRALMTDETLAVRKVYLEAGMSVKELYRMPDDHIGTELEFLYYLTQKMIELYEVGHQGESSRLFEMRSDFIKNHMASWVPAFADRVISSTSEDYFRGASLMLKGST